MVAVMSVCHYLRSATLLRLSCILAVATAFSGAALGQRPVSRVPERENQLAVWAGYGDSDNIGRASITESGTYRSLGLFMGLERQTSRLDAAINSDIEYRTYAEDRFEEESVGTLDARALVDLVDERFSWNFQGNLDQGQQDAFAARGPSNRETIRYLTTGPRLDVPFGRTNLMVNAARSAQRYSESTQVDNDSEDYQVALSRQARPTTAFAFVVGSSETDYIDGAASTYQIDQLFLRADKILRRGTLNADLGTNEIKSDTQNRRDPLVNFEWNRLLGTRSNLLIAATQGFMGTDDMGTEGGESLITTSPFERKSLGVNYGLSGDRTTVTIGVDAGEENYAGDATIDNEFRSGTFTIDYRVSGRLNVGVRYDRYKRDYQASTAPSAGQEDRTAGVWLNRTIGRRFSIALDVSRYEGTGNQRVEETRSEVRFAYSATGDTPRALTSIGR